MEKNIREVLKNFTVGIAGAGGLGSNVSENLVRSGIGKLVLADFDIVDQSNLNRQFYFKDQINTPKVKALKENLLRIDPNVQIETYNLKVTRDNFSSIFKDIDVLVEGFDDPYEKSMLLEVCTTPIVMASGIGGIDPISQFQVKSFEGVHIVGDDLDNPQMVSPRVKAAAAIQSNIVLNILLKGEYNE